MGYRSRGCGDRSDFNGALVAALLAGLAGSVASQDELQTRAEVRVTPITGSSRMLNPVVTVANLDAGDLIAGRTWWELQGIYFIETSVGFLWTPAGGSTPFAIPPGLYFNDNVHFAAEISDDGTVVGTNVFFTTLHRFPFRWTPDAGFELLAVPDVSSGWIGAAVAISADGAVTAGSVQDSSRLDAVRDAIEGPDMRAASGPRRTGGRTKDRC